jgi:hypothetical protein
MKLTLVPPLAFSVLALAGCGSGGAATTTIAGAATTTIAGAYETTITTPPAAAGTWTLYFLKKGLGNTALNGQPTAHTFTFKGSTLKSPGGGANVCPTVGTYRIHLAGKHLTFTVIHDPCTIGRALVFPGRTWTKVG